MEALSRADAQREALRLYYSEHDTLTSIDGIFKIFTVITCVVSSVLHLGGGACGSAQLAVGGATVALASAFLVTALSAASTCSLPTKAPLTWLYTDLVGSTVVGGVLLVTSLLMFSMCEVHTIVDYVHGPVALLGAVLVIVSAAIAYVEVTRRWDEALKAPPAPAATAPRELDV